jgi:hypothetical protein
VLFSLDDWPRSQAHCDASALCYSVWMTGPMNAAHCDASVDTHNPAPANYAGKSVLFFSATCRHFDHLLWLRGTAQTCLHSLCGSLGCPCSPARHALFCQVCIEAATFDGLFNEGTCRFNLQIFLICSYYSAPFLALWAVWNCRIKCE